MLWLIRYHSININDCRSYFNQLDQKLVDKYLFKFRKYDKGTKSMFNVPNIDLNKYIKLIDKHLPGDFLL